MMFPDTWTSWTAWQRAWLRTSDEALADEAVYATNLADVSDAVEAIEGKLDALISALQQIDPAWYRYFGQHLDPGGAYRKRFELSLLQ